MYKFTLTKINAVKQIIVSSC